MLWAGCAVGLALALSGTLEPEMPPRSLDAALGRPTDPAAALDAERRAEEAVEALTRACMRAAGFAYTAFVDLPPIPDPALGPLEWTERWGFGVSTSVDAAPPPATTDPTMERLARLEAQERGRYLAALDGPPHPGCRPAANQVVRGLRERLEGPLRPALDDLRAAIAAHPDAVAADGQWRRCLTAARIDVTDRGRTIPRLIATLAERVARLRVGDRAGLRSLQAEERSLAVAAARCEMAYDDALRRVSAPLERRFVEDHASALAAIRRAIDHAEGSWPTLSSP
jgi:hypothetical protein